ncbi:MAG: zinc ribbon domain-containing protein [Muribaculaceae bacterium]|nr:zinc ribbon domain-containing protein [Muribaculaceae bacterium]
MNCPKCHAANEHGARYCRICGFDFGLTRIPLWIKICWGISSLLIVYSFFAVLSRSWDGGHIYSDYNDEFEGVWVSYSDGLKIIKSYAYVNAGYFPEGTPPREHNALAESKAETDYANQWIALMLVGLAYGIPATIVYYRRKSKLKKLITA